MCCTVFDIRVGSSVLYVSYFSMANRKQMAQTSFYQHPNTITPLPPHHQYGIHCNVNCCGLSFWMIFSQAYFSGWTPFAYLCMQNISAPVWSNTEVFGWCAVFYNRCSISYGRVEPLACVTHFRVTEVWGVKMTHVIGPLSALLKAHDRPLPPSVSNRSQSAPGPLAAAPLTSLTASNI